MLWPVAAEIPARLNPSSGSGTPDANWKDTTPQFRLDKKFFGRPFSKTVVGKPLGRNRRAMEEIRGHLANSQQQQAKVYMRLDVSCRYQCRRYRAAFHPTRRRAIWLLFVADSADSGGFSTPRLRARVVAFMKMSWYSGSV